MNLRCNNNKSDLKYPDGKDFIFTIFDDTDVSTLDYIRPIYDFLQSLNMKITKSVWPLSYDGKSAYRGSHTLQHKEYARYIQVLRDNGVEIGFHGPSMVSSTRDRIEESFKVFHDVLGFYPRIYAAHSFNQENLYWGASRFSSPGLRGLYRILSREDPSFYKGHIQGSPFFWGDLALRHIDYVRGFTFNEINLLNICRTMPYSSKRHPWVKSFFVTSDADNVAEFNLLIKDQNQSKLERQRGICIISTHFGKGFLRDGKLQEETKSLLSGIAQRNGWFVPVSTALDFMKSQSALVHIEPKQIFSLELRWLMHTIIRRAKAGQYDKTEGEYLRERV